VSHNKNQDNSRNKTASTTHKQTPDSLKDPSTGIRAEARPTKQKWDVKYKQSKLQTYVKENLSTSVLM